MKKSKTFPIFFLCTTFAFSSLGLAGDKLNTNMQTMKSVANRVGNWEPKPFDLNASALSKDFQGNDPKKFFQLLENRIAKLEKGEFEKTTDYLDRISDKSKLLAPIDANAYYAFIISDTRGKYNADTETYTIEKLDFSCKDTEFKHDGVNLNLCKLATIKSNERRYQGSNAYGATMSIKEIREVAFHLAIKRDNPLFNTAYTRPFKDSFPITIQDAKNLKSDNLGALLIGRLVDPKILIGETEVYRPTFSSPYDIIVVNKAVYFEATGLVYYNLKSGKILERKIFNIQ